MNDIRLTIGHIARHTPHGAGAQGRDAAIVDIAQDLLLRHLQGTGVLDALAFKGGTSLRKLYAGNAGRFSLDLDVASVTIGADPDDALMDLIAAIEGLAIGPFRYGVTERRGKWILTYGHDFGGDSGNLLSKLDLNPPPWLPPVRRGWQPLSVHAQYGPPALPELQIIRATDRHVVDATRFPGLGALETRRTVYGTERRVILTHSQTLHNSQAAGFLQTLTKAQAQLTDLADTLARGKTRRTTDKVQEEIRSITHDPWLRRVLVTTLTGTTPAEHRLTTTTDEVARAQLEDDVFGKRILVTTHDDWSVADIVAAYRSQSDAEFSFRQLKDPHIVSFSPMHHWTEHNIRVHTFTCVLALQIAHLLRREATRAGLHHSVRDLLDQLASIQETVLIYPEHPKNELDQHF